MAAITGRGREQPRRRELGPQRKGARAGERGRGHEDEPQGGHDGRVLRAAEFDEAEQRGHGGEGERRNHHAIDGPRRHGRDQFVVAHGAVHP
jgi:hypothetical protein